MRGGIPTVHQFFPWIPGWVDLNVVVPVGATVVVLLVGIIVICVAFARRNRGPEQTRLRGDICNEPFLTHLIAYVISCQGLLRIIYNVQYCIQTKFSS